MRHKLGSPKPLHPVPSPPRSCRVYKALLHGDLVAAKEVDIGRSPAMRELFLSEASRLAQLRHPHIVTLFGLSLTPSKGVVFMELCEGEGGGGVGGPGVVWRGGLSGCPCRSLLL